MKRFFAVISLLIGIIVCGGSTKADAKETNGLAVEEKFLADSLGYQVLTEATHSTAGTVMLVSCDKDCVKLVIPNEVVYQGYTYTVTEITFENPYFEELREMVIPESITAIHNTYWNISGPLKSITFQCPYSATAELKHIPMTVTGLSAVMYVQKKELASYQKKFMTDAACTFDEGGDMYERSYPGIRVAAIGDDAMPLRFSYDRLYYEITNGTKHTVKLIGGGLSINSSMQNLANGYYKLPKTVSCKGVAFTVTCLAKFSLSDVRTVVWLPETVTKLEEQVFDTQVVGIFLPSSLSKLPKNMFCGETISQLLYIGKAPKEVKLSLNKSEVSIKKEEKKTLKVTLSKKNKTSKLVWGTNTWGFSMTQKGVLSRSHPGASIYMYSRVYVFDTDSGAFASCKLVEKETVAEQTKADGDKAKDNYKET